MAIRRLDPDEDWRGDPISPAEHAAYEKGFADGIKRMVWYTLVVTTLCLVLTVAVLLVTPR